MESAVFSAEKRSWFRSATVMNSPWHSPRSRGVFTAFWAILLTGSFFVEGGWSGFHGIMLGAVGLLILLRPPAFFVPRLWWGLACVFVLASSAAFLPAAWFPTPGWRTQLGLLGVSTGPCVAIQWRQAAEGLALQAAILFAGLWLAGHRVSAPGVRNGSIAFAIGVAVYAIIARLVQDTSSPDQAAASFGFFPNRNHTATYMAMGVLCGLGTTLQAFRNQHFIRMAIAGTATAVCLWAVTSWSVSRAGVLLVLIGLAIWIPLLGKSYLGRHGLWALGLTLLTAIGGFVLGESQVKQRLVGTLETLEKVAAAPPEQGLPQENEASASGSGADFDARIPIFRDTLRLIQAFPLTGVGVRQYTHVLPQYRRHTLLAGANGTGYLHPESDWLWVAAESGVPAMLALAALVGLALRKALRGVIDGRDRALRASCLVAAMLVPIHGLFDVPGHMISLAWAACLLFALSLHVPSGESPPPTPKATPFRLLGAALVTAALFLIAAQWAGAPVPAIATPAAALAAASRLDYEDQQQAAKAEAAGRIHNPPPAQNKLLKAYHLIADARKSCPLHRDLIRYQGYLAVYSDIDPRTTDRLLALDRFLDPLWVRLPLWQAENLADTRPQAAAALWQDALTRAGRIDRLDPKNPWTSGRTWEAIRQSARNYPDLEALVPEPPPAPAEEIR